MAAKLDGYLALVAQAYSGQLKLPAFQRDWKWRPRQVALLFDSLRQKFPIGSFLFLKQSPLVDLSPREFKGSDKKAVITASDHLVLDGQQRLTAGLELFYGGGKRAYFIDLERLQTLAKEKGVDLESGPSIRKFLTDLTTEDQYIVHKAGVKDPESLLVTKHLLWTVSLRDGVEFERALNKYEKQYPESKGFLSYLVRPYLRPGMDTQIPIANIEGDVTVDAISRIFATLNSTGKLLTPFELVVAILYPKNLNLSEDVAALRELFPYYGKADNSGELLLQTIALFDGQDTRKATLPKTINDQNYKKFHSEAAEYLNEVAKELTERLGLGLDVSSDLLVYPVAFTPMASVLRELAGGKPSVQEWNSANDKLVRAYVGSVLSRRYQQSTHDKQAKDKNELLDWVKGAGAPTWFVDCQIPSLRRRKPSGAMGKLLLSLMNKRGIHDPFTTKSVGTKSGAQASSRHHIFPTKWVKKLQGWNESLNTANLALNIMFVEQSTNASWLNDNPADQVDAVIKMHGEAKARSLYEDHLIDDKCFELVRKPQKTVDDFNEFIARREELFVAELKQFGFEAAAAGTQEEDDDEDEDD